MDKTIASYVEEGDHPGFIKVDYDGTSYSVTVHESNLGGGHTACFGGMSSRALRRFLVDVSDAVHKSEAEGFLNKGEKHLTLEEALQMIDTGRDIESKPMTEEEKEKFREAMNNAIVERNNLVEERNNLLKSTNTVHVRHYMLSKFFSTH